MIKHVMADGTKVRDISGHVVTITNRTVVAYALLAKKRRNYDGN